MWQYLWVTGTDFDGNESDRLEAGGFVALDVIQAGKVFKLAKVTTIAKGGRVIKFLNKNLLKSMSKEALDNALVDISCQFTAKLIKYLVDGSTINSRDFENCIAKAFAGIDFKGAVLDASFSITNKDKEKFEIALKCARELLCKLQEGIEVEKIKEGGWNCLVEIAALVFRNYAFKKGYDIPKLSNEKLRQVKIAFNMMDPNWYKVNESLITELLKVFYAE